MRHLSPAAAIVAVLLTSGCTGLNFLRPPMPIASEPRPNYEGPVPKHRMHLVRGDGPSLEEALHLADRYVLRHFTGLELVAAQSDQVGANGSIEPSGSWHLLYGPVASESPVGTASLAPAASSSPVASSSVRTQATTVPDRFDSPMIMLTVTGDRRVLAPESSTATGILRPFDFTRAIPLREAIEAYQKLGLEGNSFYLGVMIRTTESNHVVYELSPNAWTPPGYSGDYLPPSPGGAQPLTPNLIHSDPSWNLGASPSLGTFTIDAYTGNVPTLSY